MQIYLRAFILCAALAASLIPGSARFPGDNASRIAPSSVSTGEVRATNDVAASYANDAFGTGSTDHAATPLVRGLPQYEALHRGPRFAVAAQQPEKSCRIDPRTGCHFGHVENSHPGGCHCASFSGYETADDR